MKYEIYNDNSNWEVVDRQTFNYYRDNFGSKFGKANGDVVETAKPSDIVDVYNPQGWLVARKTYKTIKKEVL